MYKYYTIAIVFFCAACSNPKSGAPVNNEQSEQSASNVIVNSQPAAAVDSGSVIDYEIIREPNGGAGVFDFMYVVYVSKPINNAQANWLFKDLINKKGGGKIAIDVWNNKKAFYEVLKVYEKEDKIYDAGGDLKAFAKERDRVTAKYDKYNIAQYADNGEYTTVVLPEDKH